MFLKSFSKNTRVFPVYFIDVLFQEPLRVDVTFSRCLLSNTWVLRRVCWIIVFKIFLCFLGISKIFFEKYLNISCVFPEYFFRILGVCFWHAVKIIWPFHSVEHEICRQYVRISWVPPVKYLGVSLVLLKNFFRNTTVFFVCYADALFPVLLFVCGNRSALMQIFRGV